MMGRFDGKKILITGGSSGIGLATAKRLTDEGAKVMITGRKQRRLDEAANSIKGLIAVKNDAADPADGKALAERVAKEFGTLDGLFLNAGFGAFGPISAINHDHYARQFETNVFGVMQHAALLEDKLNKGGAVLITGSVAPLLGSIESAAYGATKGAVRAFGRSLARALAPRGIRVNVIAPGPIETNFFEELGMSDEEIESFSKRIQSMVPLGRFGASEEVAAVAAFLLSDDASYVTGSQLMVDGGMTMT